MEICLPALSEVKLRQTEDEVRVGGKGRKWKIAVQFGRANVLENFRNF